MLMPGHIQLFDRQLLPDLIPTAPAVPSPKLWPASFPWATPSPPARPAETASRGRDWAEKRGKLAVGQMMGGRKAPHFWFSDEGLSCDPLSRATEDQRNGSKYCNSKNYDV